MPFARTKATYVERQACSEIGLRPSPPIVPGGVLYFVMARFRGNRDDDFPGKETLMRAEELSAQFGIAGIVDFEETEAGLAKAAISLDGMAGEL